MKYPILVTSLLIASQAYAIKYPTGKLQQPVVTKTTTTKPVSAPSTPKAPVITTVKTTTTTTTVSKADTIKKTIVKKRIVTKNSNAPVVKQVTIEKTITKTVEAKPLASIEDKHLLTPERLWGLKRVAAVGLNAKTAKVYYDVRSIDIKTEKGTTQHFVVDATTGMSSSINVPTDFEIIACNENATYAVAKGSLYIKTANNTWRVIHTGLDQATAVKVSDDGQWVAYAQEVVLAPTLAKDIYKDLNKANAYVFHDLNYRHWDTWEDGAYSHIFIAPMGKPSAAIDIMKGEAFDCPQKPHGGAEDFVWHPNSKELVYVCKKLSGKAYAQSTNTDLYHYTLTTAKTKNITKGMMGYDMQPAYNEDGSLLAWTSMRRDGFEADKNDIYVLNTQTKWMAKLTGDFDETVSSFKWKSKQALHFIAPTKGTEQLFALTVPVIDEQTRGAAIQQITKGDFDVNGIVGFAADAVIVTRTDMNHANEIYKYDLTKNQFTNLSNANTKAYEHIKMSDVKMEYVTTVDGQQMGVWVVYPPDFDPNKKYPTLLYCQGGPQSALSQFYSFRWNFPLMAAQGYIVVAPNRRGMPGWGTKWNEAISGDWGGKPMDDYLSAIDAVAAHPYVDKNRLGCVGASYGGYSVFMLAGIHQNRFKTFISHCGLFDLKSWYGTTEELWFANWDIGGNYWQDSKPESYKKFSPSNYVANWNTPIMVIQGGLDYRVPIEQGLQAFQAAQLKGIKSKLLYLPNENHWVSHAHNALVWQREFFKWLDETLK
ncbi:MAG: S9 family peptidase [Bacteroidota bacterium]